MIFRHFKPNKTRESIEETYATQMANQNSSWVQFMLENQSEKPEGTPFDTIFQSKNGYGKVKYHLHH